MSETATVSPTQAEATATPATEPVQAPVSTAETTGSEAPKAAPSEETFYSGDPNSLPPELQQAYKNMLKDYKQKTQSVAEQRKKAESFDQITARPDFKDWYGGLNKQQKAEFKEQKAEAEKSLGETISNDEFQKAFETKEGFLELMAKVAELKNAKLQKETEELKQYKQVTEASQIVEAFATEQGADGKPLRPDFYELDDPKLTLISGFLSVNPPEDTSKGAYVQKLNEAYGWAQGVKNHFYNLGKSEALKIIQAKAASSTNPPTQPAKGAYTGPDPKKLSTKDAIDLAKRGIKVPQNYD